MNNEEKILSALEKQGAILESHGVMLETHGKILESLVVGQKQTNQRLDKLETDVAELKSRSIIAENENKQQFGALFDGYKQLYDISCEIRSGIAKLTAEQDTKDFQISWLEATKRKTN